MTDRPPVTAEELAGREHARRAPPMTDGRVEELLRLLRPAIATRNEGAHPATTSISTLLAPGCVTPGGGAARPGRGSRERPHHLRAEHTGGRGGDDDGRRWLGVAGQQGGGPAV